MITVRRGRERVHCTHGLHEIWHAFGRHGLTDRVEGLDALMVFDEEYVPSARTELRCAVNADLVLYVCEGVVSVGTGAETADLVAGTYIQRAAGAAKQTPVRNTSSERAQVFRIGLRPAEGAGAGVPATRWSRFDIAGRRDGFRIVASLDGRQGSLRLTRDVDILSAVLRPGRHVVRELEVGRGAWLQVVSGEGRLGTLQLTAGDGAAFVAERAIAFTASADSELLVIDLPS